jgi:enoyl-CoA hydratase/carnithine racemase
LSVDDVLYDVDEGVAVLRFNRPKRMNAETEELDVRYIELLRRADDDPAVRVVVVTGAGEAFCPGADLEWLSEIQRTGYPDGFPRPLERYALDVRKPVVAAINGACAGGGLVYALTCDLRFAASEAKISTAFARRGLVAERGMSWLLPRLVGTGTACDLLLSGRTVTGEEAARLGLVDRVVAPDLLMPTTMEWARDVARACSPSAMATIKQQLIADSGRDLTASLAGAADLLLGALTAPELREGIDSFVERRPPVFAPLPPRPVGERI